MKTFEYENTVIEVPESWADIQLGHYEKFYKMRTSNADEGIELVAFICKTSAATLREWPAEIFNLIYDTLGFIFKDEELPVSAVLEKDGRTWMVNVEDKLSLGEWIDAEEAQKGIKPLTGTLAVVCRPVGEKYDMHLTEERENFFAALTVEEVKPLLGFFLHCNNVLEERTHVYGNLAQIVQTLPKGIKSLRKLGAGTILLRVWPIIKYIYLVRLLKRQLRKYLPT